MVPPNQNETAVINEGVCTDSRTHPSGIDHKRNFLSIHPDTKQYSFVGWKSTDVTISLRGEGIQNH